MNSTHHLVQMTVWLTFIFTLLVVVAALVFGYIDLGQLRGMSAAVPPLVVLGLFLGASLQTSRITNERDAARLDSFLLVVGHAWVARSAHITNQRRTLRPHRLAWALVVATGAVAVIESANMLVWNAPEVVALGVFWLDSLVFIQVLVLVLALTYERAAAGHFSVQSGGSGGYPNRTTDLYADKGSYRPRVTPGQPHPRRHPNPSGHRRPVADTSAGPNADARRPHRPANTAS